MALTTALPRLDSPVIYLSWRRSSLTRILTGLPVVTLITRGRRSGKLRRCILVGIPDEGKIILIASNFGRLAHPGWYYNLRANPHAQVRLDGHTYPCLARLVCSAEREECLRRAEGIYPGYRAYQQRAAPREIGAFVLEFTLPPSSRPPNTPGLPPAVGGQPGRSEDQPTGSAGGSGNLKAA